MIHFALQASRLWQVTNDFLMQPGDLGKQTEDIDVICLTVLFVITPSTSQHSDRRKTIYL